MVSKLTIALDGPAGSGKTTVGTAVSEQMHMLLLDSGLVYRLVTFACLEQNVLQNSVINETKLHRLLKTSKFEVRVIDQQNHYFINKKNVTTFDLSTVTLTKEIKYLASHLEVRHFVNQFCQAIAEQYEKVIITGRDAATNIVPQAHIKIFLTASLKDRIKRRYVEKTARHEMVNYEQLAQEMHQRDMQDYQRKEGRLSFNKNYILIDSSNWDFPTTVAKVITVIKEYQNG